MQPWTVMTTFKKGGPWKEVACCWCKKHGKGGGELWETKSIFSLMPGIIAPGTSLVTQRLTMHLPMQGSGLTPGLEDATCHRTMTPQLLKTRAATRLCTPRACALQQRKPHNEPTHRSSREPAHRSKAPAQPKARVTGLEHWCFLSMWYHLSSIIYWYTYLPIMYYLLVSHQLLSSDDRIDSIFLHKFLRHIYKTF